MAHQLPATICVSATICVLVQTADAKSGAMILGAEGATVYLALGSSSVTPCCFIIRSNSSFFLFRSTCLKALVAW